MQLKKTMNKKANSKTFVQLHPRKLDGALKTKQRLPTDLLNFEPSEDGERDRS